MFLNTYPQKIAINGSFWERHINLAVAQVPAKGP
jgi:hypothetical protein